MSGFKTTQKNKRGKIRTIKGTKNYMKNLNRKKSRSRTQIQCVNNLGHLYSYEH